jgi:hypothetical protein
MADIELLLRDYGRQLDEKCPHITLSENQQRLEMTNTVDSHLDGHHDKPPVVFDLRDSEQHKAPPSKNRWLGAAIAVAATILLMAGILLVSEDRDAIVGKPGSSTVMTDSTSSPALTRSSPATSIRPSSSPWSPVPHDEEVFGGLGDQWMSDVTAGGPGLVAVGSIGSSFGHLLTGLHGPE